MTPVLRDEQLLALAEAKVLAHARELLPELLVHWPGRWAPLSLAERKKTVEALGKSAFRLGLGGREFLRRFLHLASREGFDFLDRPEQAWRKGIFGDLWMEPRQKLMMAGASLPLDLLMEG